jgi:hypothetical protein
MARKTRRPKQRQSRPLAAVGDRKRRPASSPEAGSIAAAKVNVDAIINQGLADVINAMAAAEAAIIATTIGETSIAINRQVAASQAAMTSVQPPPLPDLETAEQAVAVAMEASNQAVAAVDTQLKTVWTTAHQALGAAMHAADRSVAAASHAADRSTATASHAADRSTATASHAEDHSMAAAIRAADESMAAADHAAAGAVAAAATPLPDNSGA